MNRIMTLCATLVLACIMGVQVFAQSGYEVKGVVVDQLGPVSELQSLKKVLPTEFQLELMATIPSRCQILLQS